MRDALALFDPHLSSYIDGRHVVSSLVLESFRASQMRGRIGYAQLQRNLQRRHDTDVLTEEWMCTLWIPGWQEAAWLL
jgi:hypothetical protein